jgi:AcrR family transcriptional regulator
MAAATRRVPRTDRGEKTRDVLVDAAREVFWSKGYIDARVADIVQFAGVSHGSFYTYFDSKEAVLRAVAADLHDAIVETQSGTRAETGGDEVRAIELANRRYLEFYLDNRKAMHLIEQVASHNAEMREARWATRRAFVARTARSLRRLQADERCDPGLDPDVAAEALVSMISHYVFHMVATRTAFDVDVAVATLTTLWARGIGLAVPWDRKT